MRGLGRIRLVIALIVLGGVAAAVLVAIPIIDGKSNRTKARAMRNFVLPLRSDWRTEHIDRRTRENLEVLFIPGDHDRR